MNKESLGKEVPGMIANELSEALTSNLSLDKTQNEVGLEVCGQKKSNEWNVLIKDLDPFFLLKTSSTLLSFNLTLSSLILFFKLLILFLIPLNFLDLESVSSEVRVADAGNFLESKWNLN